jgi:hypothetical protein
MKRFKIEKRLKTNKSNLPHQTKKEKKKEYNMKQTSRAASSSNCKRNKVSLRGLRCEEAK